MSSAVRACLARRCMAYMRTQQPAALGLPYCPSWVRPCMHATCAAHAHVCCLGARLTRTDPTSKHATGGNPQAGMTTGIADKTRKHPLTVISLPLSLKALKPFAGPAQCSSDHSSWPLLAPLPPQHAGRSSSKSTLASCNQREPAGLQPAASGPFCPPPAAWLHISRWHDARGAMRCTFGLGGQLA